MYIDVFENIFLTSFPMEIKNFFKTNYVVYVIVSLFVDIS